MERCDGVRRRALANAPVRCACAARQARTARAEALYLQAVNRARDTAVRARSEVRESHAALRERHAVAPPEPAPPPKPLGRRFLDWYLGWLGRIFTGKV